MLKLTRGKVVGARIKPVSTFESFLEASLTGYGVSGVHLQQQAVGGAALAFA